MLDWISQHQKVLSVLISFGTLLIWLVYAQLLYQSYRRQRRPRIVINRGKHRSVNALCLISNMSAESVFVEHIVARLETDRGVFRADVTELEQDYEQGDEHREQRHGTAPDSLRDSTRQGRWHPANFCISAPSTASSSGSAGPRACPWKRTTATSAPCGPRPSPSRWWRSTAPTICRSAWSGAS
ncbi:hypothetical protein HML84_07495 [Alcanivorax sp. IO_7]|nr:hypothetical protein HML84_07495 [Alcanivorax sp. IO_7]